MAEEKISAMLWYNTEAEAAAKHYVSAFKDGKITGTERYGDAGPGPKGSVMTVDFEIGGRRFTALNGGPMFKPTEATSFVISCENQAEVDRLWDHFSKGGSTSMCGWLKDKWGFSWQIVPKQFFDAMRKGTEAQKTRVFAVMMQMTKFDVAKIEAAFRG
jgi:predicted 3-demethylubiquinone-9 3-methyltransferase (glyoxalase superfamily)